MEKICLPNEENPVLAIVRNDDDDGYVIEQYDGGKIYGMLDLDDEEAKMLAVGMFGLILQAGK